MDKIISAVIAGVASIIVAFIASGVFSDYFVKEKAKDIKLNLDLLPSWEVLYSHSEKGIPIEGSIEKLIDAVNKGYDIKIIHRVSDSVATIVPADFVRIHDGVVSVQNVNNISWWEDKDTKELYFPEKAYNVYLLFDTKGNYRAYRTCLLYTSPSPRDLSTSRMPSSA